jgi:hypothetical protein
MCRRAMVRFKAAPAICESPGKNSCRSINWLTRNFTPIEAKRAKQLPFVEAPNRARGHLSKLYLDL